MRANVHPDPPSDLSVLKVSCQSNKEIFEYIQASLDIFELFSKNIQKICLICPTLKGQKEHVRLFILSVQDVQSPLEAQYDNLSIHFYTLALSTYFFIEFHNIDNNLGTSPSFHSIVVTLQSVWSLWLRLFLQISRIVSYKILWLEVEKNHSILRQLFNMGTLYLVLSKH